MAEDAARTLISLAPPGEIDDIFNDVRTILDDDETLRPVAADTFRQVHLRHLLTVFVSHYNELENGVYLDPRSGKCFTFDHVRQQATEAQEFNANEDHAGKAWEGIRDEIARKARLYVADHYPGGRTEAFYHDGSLVVLIVAHKYNPGNFWNGRWRCVWTIDPATGAIKGEHHVNVHYFEEGNIHLNFDKTTCIETGVPFLETTDETEVASRIVKEIKKAEEQIGIEITAGYADLVDHTFRHLRRNLPITRNKLDWEKIGNYRIGDELSQR